MRELLDAGKIKARSKWKEVYPLFREDERYLNLLGNPGSNPLELFWDVVDKLDQQLDAKVAIVEDAIHRYNEKRAPAKDSGSEKHEDKEKEKEKEKPAFTFTVDTTEEQLREILKEDSNDKTNNLSDEDFKEIYNHLHAEAVKKLEAEKRRYERKQRHLQDDLRYALKKLSKPIDLNASYEEVRRFGFCGWQCAITDTRSHTLGRPIDGTSP